MLGKGNESESFPWTQIQHHRSIIQEATYKSSKGSHNIHECATQTMFYNNICLHSLDKQKAHIYRVNSRIFFFSQVNNHTNFLEYVGEDIFVQSARQGAIWQDTKEEMT